jgi:hypothetical protein
VDEGNCAHHEQMPFDGAKAEAELHDFEAEQHDNKQKQSYFHSIVSGCTCVRK